MPPWELTSGSALADRYTRSPTATHSRTLHPEAGEASTRNEWGTQSSEAGACTVSLERGRRHRSDNESSLLALLARVEISSPGIEIVSQTSPAGDHAAKRTDRGGPESVGDATWQTTRRDRSVARLEPTPRSQLCLKVRSALRWSHVRLEKGQKTFEATPSQIRRERESGSPSTGARWRPSTYCGLYIGDHERKGSPVFLIPEGVMRSTKLQKNRTKKKKNKTQTTHTNKQFVFNIFRTGKTGKTQAGFQKCATPQKEGRKQHHPKQYRPKEERERKQHHPKGGRGTSTSTLLCALRHQNKEGDKQHHFKGGRKKAAPPHTRKEKAAPPNLSR